MNCCNHSQICHQRQSSRKHQQKKSSWSALKLCIASSAPAASSNSSADVAKPEPLVWSDIMVTILLELRLRKFEYVFLGSKSNAQRSIAWEKVRFQFNIQNTCCASVKSLKNKYNILKSEFASIRHAENIETGNMTNDPIVYPSYWEILVEYFGDMLELGCHEFGSSDKVAINVDDSSSNSDSSHDIGDAVMNGVKKNGSKRKAEVAVELSRQRQNWKTKKNDVESAVIAMGDALAKGLVDATRASSADPTNTLDPKKIDLILQSIEESKSINAALLNTIKQNNEIQQKILERL